MPRPIRLQVHGIAGMIFLFLILGTQFLQRRCLEWLIIIACLGFRATESVYNVDFMNSDAVSIVKLRPGMASAHLDKCFVAASMYLYS